MNSKALFFVFLAVLCVFGCNRPQDAGKNGSSGGLGNQVEGLEKKEGCSSCEVKEEEAKMQEDSDKKALVDMDESLWGMGCNAFGIGVLRDFKGLENVSVSSYSLCRAFGMLMYGARGKSEASLKMLMHVPLDAGNYHEVGRSVESSILGSAGSDVEINIANRLWGEKTEDFLDAFKSGLEKSYGAGFEAVDFKGAAEKVRLSINSWVSEQTKDKIKDLLPAGSVNSLSRLILTNAVYFKSKWAMAFDAKMSDPKGVFYKADGSEVKKVMMQKRGHFGYYEDEQMQYLKMYYVGNGFSMIFALPKDKAYQGSIFEAFDARGLDKVFHSFERSDVKVSLPKFKIESKMSMVEMLNKMGLENVFSGDVDFSGMNGEKDLFVSGVHHQVFIEVDESGTEAAAATGVVMAVRSMPTQKPKIVEFKADHPFAFMLIEEKFGTVLFMGEIVQ